MAFELRLFESRDAAVAAWRSGKIESLFYESEWVTPEVVRDHARRTGLGGVHGMVEG